MTHNEQAFYIGKILHERGFKDWFLYFFKFVKGYPFIVDQIHQEIFQEFQSIYNLEYSRSIINVPPRAGKTTLATYFVAYALAVNPKCNFIYTSYSQTLLKTISMELQSILESPIYKAYYGNANVYENINEKPIDEFWAKFLYNEIQNKTMYSATKITTSQGGVVLLSSVGSSITGFGAGMRSVTNTFSGCLICDDLNKVANIDSDIMRKKVHNYYIDTLLTRLNNSSVGIINIQQRLHAEDLSGFLMTNYKFHTLEKALLIDPVTKKASLDGICQLPSQYSKERIAELMVQMHTFLTQYQQNPTARDNTFIKDEYLQRMQYNYMLAIPFEKVVISCDLSFTGGDNSDYNAFTVWGIKAGNFYLLEPLRVKMEFIRIKQVLRDIVFKWHNKLRIKPTIYIEAKANGNALLSEIKDTMPDYNAFPYNPVKSKEDRLLQAMPSIQAKRIYIADSIDIHTNHDLKMQRDFVNEILDFPNVKNDDFVDTLTQVINSHNAEPRYIVPTPFV